MGFPAFPAPQRGPFRHRNTFPAWPQSTPHLQLYLDSHPSSALWHKKTSKLVDQLQTHRELLDTQNQLWVPSKKEAHEAKICAVPTSRPWSFAIKAFIAFTLSFIHLCRKWRKNHQKGTFSSPTWRHFLRLRSLASNSPIIGWSKKGRSRIQRQWKLAINNHHCWTSSHLIVASGLRRYWWIYNSRNTLSDQKTSL